MAKRLKESTAQMMKMIWKMKKQVKILMGKGG